MDGRWKIEAGDRSSGCDGAEALADRLAEEMATAWRQGDRPLVEEFLARHPGIGDHPRAAVRLMYEEFCLRQEYGEVPSSAEVADRFPRGRAEFEALLECHCLLQPGPAAPAFPRAGEMLGEFRLLAELGHGALGRVFLAVQ